MPLHTTDALILRTYKLGESDRIVVFLTRDRGKKRGVAKNARQSRRRFGGALEPMTCGRVGVSSSASGAIWCALDYVEPLRSPLSAADGDALGYVELLRRADRRVGAGGRSERDAVTAWARRWSTRSRRACPIEPLARYFEYWLLRLQGVYQAGPRAVGGRAGVSRRRRGASSPFALIGDVAVSRADAARARSTRIAR